MERSLQSLVLASGGIDSSTLLALLSREGTPVHALFLDYGQPAARSEQESVTMLCESLRIPLRCVTYRGARFGAGEIRGRNAFLLHTALLEFDGAAGTVGIGIHAGTAYRDCSPDFLTLMKGTFDFHTGGAISVSAPFIDWTKGDIIALAHELCVPVDLTHSCEVADQPCGTCDSCLDRAFLLGSNDP